MDNAKNTDARNRTTGQSARIMGADETVHTTRHTTKIYSKERKRRSGTSMMCETIPTME